MTTRVRLMVISLVAVLVPLMGVSLAHAQTQAPPPASTSSGHGGIGIGVKGGLLFATIAEAGEPNAFKNRNGIIGGLFLGGNRTGIVGVGVDLLYARKGGKDPNSSTTLDLDYVNVPVYVRINGGSSSLNGVIGYGIVGVDLNFLLKGKLSTGEDVKSEFERADYGFVVGGGVEITRVVVEARFTQGVGNIAKDKSASVLKSKSFAIMIGVRFN